MKLITEKERDKILYEAGGSVKVAMLMALSLSEKRAKRLAFNAWCASCDLYDLSVNPKCAEDFEKWYQDPNRGVA